jgi:hypothetical protein
MGKKGAGAGEGEGKRKRKGKGKGKAALRAQDAQRQLAALLQAVAQGGQGLPEGLGELLRGVAGAGGARASRRVRRDDAAEQERLLAADPLVQRKRLQDRLDAVARRNEILRGRCQSLDLQRDALEQAIVAEKLKKRDAGGVQAKFDATLKAQSRCRVLSAQLDRLSEQACGAELVNCQLVHDIDARRKEKLILDNLAERLRRQFETRQRELAELLAAANTHYEARNRAVRDAGEREAAEAAEVAAAEQELRHLGELLARQEALNSSLQTASLKRGVTLLEEQLKRGGLDPEEEARLRARLAKLSQRIERKKSDMAEAQVAALGGGALGGGAQAGAGAGGAGSICSDSARGGLSHRASDVRVESAQWSYETAFRRVIDNAMRERGSTTPPTLAEVVAQFVNQYDDALDCLGHVASTNAETVKLEAQAASLRAELARFAKEQLLHDVSKERIKSDLEAKLAAMRETSASAAAKGDADAAALTGVVEAVDRLSIAFTGESAQQPRGLPLWAEETQARIMQRLGQIEHHTIDMCLQLQRRLRDGRSIVGAASQTLATGSAAGGSAAGKRQAKTPASESAGLRRAKTAAALVETRPADNVASAEAIAMLLGPQSPAKAARRPVLQVPQFTQASLDAIFADESRPSTSSDGTEPPKGRLAQPQQPQLKQAHQSHQQAQQHQQQKQQPQPQQQRDERDERDEEDDLDLLIDGTGRAHPFGYMRSDELRALAAKNLGGLVKIRSEATGDVRAWTVNSVP